MEANSVSDQCDGSLDLVEKLMEQDEEFGIECSEDDVERWRKGDLPGDWLNGSPVPRRPQRPTLPGGAEASPDPDDQPDTN